MSYGLAALVAKMGRSLQSTMAHFLSSLSALRQIGTVEKLHTFLVAFDRQLTTDQPGRKCG